MTITDFAGTEPAIIPATSTVPPRCQGMLECPERCCDPVPCPRPAAARVSLACRRNGCDHGADLLLMCERCSEHADAIGPVLARRPL